MCEFDNISSSELFSDLLLMYVLVLQLGPLNPGAHTQEKPSPLTTQTPSLLQGLESQFLSSTTRKYIIVRYILIDIFARGLLICTRNKISFRAI